MAERDIDIDALFQVGNEDALGAYLHLLHPADIAELFNFVDGQNWTQITSRLTPEKLADVIADLDEHQRESLGQVLATDRLIEAVEELETDDAADVIADLPSDKYTAVLTALEDRDEIEALLAYADDTAGGIMQTELCRVQQNALVADAIEAVRRTREEVEDIFEVYVVDDLDRLQGAVALEDLVLTSASEAISTITEPLEQTVTADVDQEEVAVLFRKYDVASLPVVTPEGVLLGRITFDDVHDVIEEEASEDIMAMAGGSTEELVYGGDILKIVAYRLPWLLSSLLGSLITTQLVPMFSRVQTATVDAIVLAAFVPVVMAMTGNVGSQSAMIITRGFAIGKVEFSNLGRTIFREMLVGFLMGLAAGLVVGAFGHFSHHDIVLGLTLATSMICSMSAATMVGVVAPAVFKKVGIDPAIAAGPLVTTGCDVLGVSVYLLVVMLVMM